MHVTSPHCGHPSLSEEGLALPGQRLLSARDSLDVVTKAGFLFLLLNEPRQAILLGALLLRWGILACEHT
jgi:hypothetical protein